MPGFSLTRSRFYTALFFLLPLLVFSVLPSTTEDLCVWVAQGLASLRAGALLRVDPFSLLPTKPLVYPAGITLLYGLLDQLGGLGALVIFHRLVLIALLWVLYRGSLARLRDPWSGWNPLWVLLSLSGCLFGFVERPSLVAELPFLFCFLILEKDRPLGPKDCTQLLLAEALWVNLHGSFFLLPLLWGWRLFARRGEYLLGWRAPETHRIETIAFAAAWLVPLLNPFGWKIYPYVFETATISMQRMEEWQVTTPAAFFPQGLLFFVLLGVVGFGIYKKYLGKPFPLSSVYFPLLALGLTAIRHTDLAFLTTLPFALRVGWLHDSPPAEELPRPLNAAIASLFLFLCLVLNPWTKPSFAFLLPEKFQPVFSGTAPFALARILNEDPLPGGVFHHLDFGSFLTYAQKRKTFLDSRNIIFTDDSVRTYFRILDADVGWEKALHSFDVRYVLLKPENEALRTKLQGHGWYLAGKTDAAVLLVRP